jgi:ribose 5-phosphate isomerase A
VSTGPQAQDLDALGQSALRFVEDGMLLGLGTGRAAEAFIRALGARVASGLSVRGVPTSVRSALLAGELGIPLTTLDEVDHLDVAFDGADEVTPDLQLTKGLGGALLRERVVAVAARRFVVLVTPEKLVPKLGTRCPIPIEVVAFARVPATRALARLGATPTLRTTPEGGTVLTDNGNPILDARFAPIDDPALLEAAIRRIPGVIDTGMFLGMAERVLVGEAGNVRELASGS